MLLFFISDRLIYEIRFLWMLSSLFNLKVTFIQPTLICSAANICLYSVYGLFVCHCCLLCIVGWRLEILQTSKKKSKNLWTPSVPLSSSQNAQPGKALLEDRLHLLAISDRSTLFYATFSSFFNSGTSKKLKPYYLFGKSLKGVIFFLIS